jgi:hypothetical protein
MCDDDPMIGLDDRRYQAFVSSTFEDLQEERQKVLQAVLEMKAFPTGMELFPSADDEQWAFIQREIESSDYYIVITAGKYGSVAEDGLSFTEKEYDYAISLKKYVISFIRRDLLGLEGRQLEQETHRRHRLETFHKKVKQSKLVKFYSSAEELKSLVMQALMHAFQFQPKEGWVRAKNARRIEDLEEVTSLQKRVMELQAENARLSADPTEPFAQGSDTAEWVLPLAAVTVGAGVRHEPPEDDFAFRTTWNDLLAAIFADANPQVHALGAANRVGKLIASQLANRFPDCEWTAAQVRWPSTGVDKEGMKNLMTAVKRQLLGLDMIDVEQIDGNHVWYLKQRGRLQLLAICGLRRQHDQPAESSP